MAGTAPRASLGACGLGFPQQRHQKTPCPGPPSPKSEALDPQRLGALVLALTAWHQLGSVGQILGSGGLDILLWAS